MVKRVWPRAFAMARLPDLAFRWSMRCRKRRVAQGEERHLGSMGLEPLTHVLATAECDD